MAEQPKPEADHLTELTCQVVAAYVTHNAVAAADLPKLLADVYQGLATLTLKVEPPPVDAQMPAVSIKKSITPDFLICLEDGKKFKSLKRHLSQLGLTPQQYRDKWHLPHDYPMVAPNYSATRSNLAKNNGLGRKATT